MTGCLAQEPNLHENSLGTTKTLTSWPGCDSFPLRQQLQLPLPRLQLPASQAAQKTSAAGKLLRTHPPAQSRPRCYQLAAVHLRSGTGRESGGQSRHSQCADAGTGLLAGACSTQHWEVMPGGRVWITLRGPKGSPDARQCMRRESDAANDSVYTQCAVARLQDRMAAWLSRERQMLSRCSVLIYGNCWLAPAGPKVAVSCQGRAWQCLTRRA